MWRWVSTSIPVPVSATVITEYRPGGTDVARSADASRTSTLAVSIGELHQVVRAIADAIRAQGIPHTEVKRALVFATDAESFAFYETAALNRNQYIRIFRDPDAARRWLAEPDE